MEFEDEFEVPSTKAETWKVLTDIERVYPCLPGAELEDVTDDVFTGMVTLRLGPVTAAYRGSARFEDLDEEQGTLTIRAEGRDKHGQGTAKATIRARLTAEGESSTRVAMSNNVEITGKAAQFGRGIIEDVSREILGQFASCLRDVVVAPSGEGPADSTNGSPAFRPEPDQSIDVLALGTRVAVKRARESPRALVAIATAVLLWIILRGRR